MVGGGGWWFVVVVRGSEGWWVVVGGGVYSLGLEPVLALRPDVIEMSYDMIYDYD